MVTTTQTQEKPRTIGQESVDRAMQEFAMRKVEIPTHAHSYLHQISFLDNKYYTFSNQPTDASIFQAITKPSSISWLIQRKIVVFIVPHDKDLPVTRLGTEALKTQNKLLL